jgi:myo-inositol-1(or 4)-monophosphatase
LAVCERAARAGGQVLLDWQGRFRTKHKGPKDVVTEADLASQQVIRDIVLGVFPKHQFLGEESDPSELAAFLSAKPAAKGVYRWIVDPLDGTSNYVHGMPAFTVSVALERAGRLLAGVVYDPIANECFSAAAGQGATLNGQPIKSSRCRRLHDALIAVSFSNGVARGSPEIQRFLEVLYACHAVRRLGSAALCLAYVACGRLDGYFGCGCKSWDVAAGALILTEAGGAIASRGQPTLDLRDCTDFASAANPKLQAELVATLARAE